MPRAPRIDAPGFTYHVMSRGVRRLPIFASEADRQMLLRLLAAARLRYPFRLHAYCLMTNHYHFLIETIDHRLAQIFHHVKTAYAKWFNGRAGHVGHVFQGRYHSIIVQQDAYFTTAARYIHLNPVRAGLVRRPEDYPWSNYGRLIEGDYDALVDPVPLLGFFGHEPARQLRNYKKFVEDGLRQRELITDRTLLRMRSWGEIPGDLRKINLSPASA